MKRELAIKQAMHASRNDDVPLVVYRILNEYHYSPRPPSSSEYIVWIDGIHIRTFDGRMMIEWHKVSDRLPADDGETRVLVYCDGVDFSGQQFVDIPVSDFYEYDDEGVRPEVAEAATHWAFLPYPEEV